MSSAIHGLNNSHAQQDQHKNHQASPSTKINRHNTIFFFVFIFTKHFGSHHNVFVFIIQKREEHNFFFAFVFEDREQTDTNNHAETAQTNTGKNRNGIPDSEESSLRDFGTSRTKRVFLQDKGKGRGRRKQRDTNTINQERKGDLNEARAIERS